MKLLRNALVLAALVGGTLTAVAGGVPLIPSSPTYNEPSQIVSTLNAFINQLNGNPLGSGGYATQANGSVSLGSYGTISGATPQTLNTQRGLVTFTGVTVAAQAAGNVVINNSLITTASVCQVTLQTFSGTFGTNGTPYIFTVTPTAGVLTVAIGNSAAANSTGSASFGVAYNCVN
jgi:hypothetical protein